MTRRESARFCQAPVNSCQRKCSRGAAGLNGQITKIENHENEGQEVEPRDQLHGSDPNTGKSTTMKKFSITTAAAAALTAGVLGLAAPALAAPSGGNAADTISALEADGSRVIVTRQSGAPLEEASVVSITRGPLVRHAVPFATSQGDHTRSVSSQTIYVTVK